MFATSQEEQQHHLNSPTAAGGAAAPPAADREQCRSANILLSRHAAIGFLCGLQSWSWNGAAMTAWSFPTYTFRQAMHFMCNIVAYAVVRGAAQGKVRGGVSIRGRSCSRPTAC